MKDFEDWIDVDSLNEALKDKSRESDGTSESN